MSIPGEFGLRRRKVTKVVEEVVKDLDAFPKV